MFCLDAKKISSISGEMGKVFKILGRLDSVGCCYDVGR